MGTQINWYLKKVAKVFFSLILIFSLSSCPGDVMDCNDFGSITRVDDLILIEPEQMIYNQGDSVIMALNISSRNTYYGQEIDIYDRTGDNSGLLVLAFDGLFTNNELYFIKGSQGEYPNWFNVPYNPQTNMYELEVIITLNNLGEYSFLTLDDLTFNGTGCNRFRIDTNVLWSGDAVVEFMVIE